MLKRVLVIAVVLMLVLQPVASASAAGKAKNSEGLRPGEFVVFEKPVPINLVFVGYDEAQINLPEMLAELPETYTPIVRYPPFYGLEGRDMGLKFNFEYKTLFTSNQFENRFFKALTRMGVPGDPTAYQEAYNDQVTNVLDVTGPVLYIDAPSVEKYLWGALNGLGIRPTKGYTIFFINWYNRPDFQFHVYTKTDEPDIDTGYNFGVERASRAMIAWGGSHGRSWFYDLSAGPEAWTDNWAVDFPDLDGNGAEDYRMPAIWEYVAGGYRDPAALSMDLAYITRFVGINLLFTSSPLYDPLNTAPGLNGYKVMHLEMFEDDPAGSGLDWLNMGYVYDVMARFEPYYDWHAVVEDNNPIDAAAQRSLQIFSEVLVEDDCWNAFGTPFAQLFCFFDANRAMYLPPYNPNDYVVPLFNFHTTAASLGSQFGLLGFADDNWVDGTQSYVFTFGAAEYRDLGYGFSTTVTHEAGHHIGLSHPHDGYDSELDIDYGPSDDFYFAWSGDESNTLMQYIALSNYFGRFDRDNMYRYEFAGYMNWANELSARLMADPHAKLVKPNLNKAKALARLAEKAFYDWDYLRAVTYAYKAYQWLLAGADKLGIDPAPVQRAPLGPPSQIPPHFGDPIRFPDS